MKKLIVIIILLVATTANASQKAITDTGEEVILSNDGTWVYSEGAQKSTNTIETNKNIFTKPKESTFLLKSTRNDSAFWTNSTKWLFTKSKNNPDAEYEFNLKGEDLYAMAITEGVEIPIDSLASIVVNNLREEAPDAKIVKQEYRNVNGKKVIYIEYSGTIYGIKAMYLAYIHSDASGSTQLIVFTAVSLVDRYRSEINNFLNGIATQ